jgi:hypothetical protein
MTKRPEDEDAVPPPTDEDALKRLEDPELPPVDEEEEPEDAGA